MSTLYENIKYYCDKANISGAKLCADCGISKSTLTSLKQGRTKKISADNLYKMANRLGVTVDDLLTAHRPHIIIGGEKHELKRMQPEWVNWEKVFENFEMVDFGENEKNSAPKEAEFSEDDMELLARFKAADEATQGLIRIALGLK